jgi:alkylation response protein AidB-like acyl-CoA dehydrogenase
LDYAKTREQFGKPIIENQGVAFQLADMATQIDAARLMVWRASWKAATGGSFDKAEGSMSKLFAGETTRLAYMTDEAQEGRDQFLEKRDPDWSPYPWYY